MLSYQSFTYVHFSITVQDVGRSECDSNELRSNVWNFSVSRISFFTKFIPVDVWAYNLHKKREKIIYAIALNTTETKRILKYSNIN